MEMTNAYLCFVLFFRAHSDLIVIFIFGVPSFSVLARSFESFDGKLFLLGSLKITKFSTRSKFATDYSQQTDRQLLLIWKKAPKDISFK